MAAKSTIDEIRARFDQDVERFSNLETAQAATIDAPLVLDLITTAAAAITPGARSALDVGCGAGNYSVKLLQHLPGLAITLVDLSRPMLDRAVQRVSSAGAGAVTAVQCDVREFSSNPESFDVVMAAAVFHHLRNETEWEGVFSNIHKSLRPGGGFWISDLVEHSTAEVQSLMWRRYGDYLAGLKDAAYRDHVLSYVEMEDTPRSLMFQLDLLRTFGFRRVEILHKNGPFAAFGGVK